MKSFNRIWNKTPLKKLMHLSQLKLKDITAVSVLLQQADADIQYFSFLTCHFTESFNPAMPAGAQAGGSCISRKH